VGGSWLREDYDGYRLTATLQGEALIKVLLVIAVVAVIAGCSNGEKDSTVNDVLPGSGSYSTQNTYTTHRANGYFSGSGSIPVESLKIEFSTADNPHKWVVAGESSLGGTAWALVREDGSWASFRVNGDEPVKVKSSSPLEEHLLPPILVEREDGDIDLAINAVSKPVDHDLASALSEFDNMPDGMSVLGQDSLIYSYADPTDQYPHGALGDRIEWKTLVAGLVSPGRTLDRIVLAEDDVFEGLFPLVADVDSDGRDEIVTTLSNPESGARVVVLEYPQSRQIGMQALSEPVGRGFRWLHQIAVAPFGPNGEIEIAVVQTPHIGGIAKFYRLAGDRLELVASKAGGYMSHVNGSRNLDQAVAGDFDGDGAVELIVPSRGQKTLIALRRVGDSVEEVWTLELGSRLATNLAVVETEDGGLVLGAASEDGVLHIWQ
jgi:hypothetical protein